MVLKKLLAALFALVWLVPAQSEEIFFLADIPAQHSQIIMSSGWDEPIQWADDLGAPPMDCLSSASKQRSQCMFTTTLPASVPAEATRVMIRVKAVAQLDSVGNPPNGQEEDVFVLAHAYNPNTGENGNHLIHCEVWGDGSNGQQLRRRVCYTEAWLPVHDGKVYLRVGKRILVDGYASITVTLEGYYM